ncbi:GntR family transcriptional regulator [Calidithermus chliarophilus]|uniref:GntR family transcriptional regulator n=1 Tax=Calidithermus chliarophilus TaxID=52023 RepID=UPI00048A1151|nr:GntR family transcriptional regulator [Calidithermus chliarophilus]
MNIPMLPPNERVVDTVRETLREAILEGRLAPGQKLSVPELARQMGVSRSPVREAILQLVGEGLAVERTRRGVVVANLSARDLGEIYEVREVLEALAVRLAAQRARPEQLRAMRDVLERQRQAVESRDPQLYSQTNQQLHTLISQSSGNPRLQRILALLFGEMQLAFRTLSNNPAHTMRGHQEHRRIVEALEARDSGAAEAAMRRHLASTRLEIDRLSRARH